MSERTAQCEECTTVFPCNPTGRLPKLCPSCKGGETERANAPAKRRKKSSTPSLGAGGLLGGRGIDTHRDRDAGRADRITSRCSGRAGGDRVTRRKEDAEQVPPPRAFMLMTKADWEKVADANARAEREPDPAQIVLTEIAPPVES